MIKIGRFFQLVLLILIAAGAQPATSSFWQWSTTAANNANADPSIDWSEGMSPSSVNDSARAMMAALAAYNNDTSGFNPAGGTASAISFSTAQGFGSAANLSGRSITFLYNVSASNNAGITLSVDGITGIIYTSFGVPVPAASMVLGGVYTVTFYSADNSFRLHDFYQSPFSVPLGVMMPYTGTTPPNSNFIFPAGQCLSTTTYATYWALLGSPASGSCPGGQFAVVDMRGRVPVALDNLNGTPANRLTSSGTGCGTAMTSVGASCVNGTESKTLTLAQIPAGITSAGGALAVSGATTVNLLYNGNAAQNLTSGTNGFGWSNSPTVGTAEISGTTAAQSVTSNNTSGGAHATMDPNIAVTYILRVL